MTISFPTIVSILGAAGAFSVFFKLKKFRVSEIPPKSRTGLSREERQHKITIGAWISFGLAIFWVAAAFVFLWLAN